MLFYHHGYHICGKTFLFLYGIGGLRLREIRTSTSPRKWYHRFIAILVVFLQMHLFWRMYRTLLSLSSNMQNQMPSSYLDVYWVTRGMIYRYCPLVIPKELFESFTRALPQIEEPLTKHQWKCGFCGVSGHTR